MIMNQDVELVTQELGEQVKELIERVYECCYTGKLKILKFPSGYQVFIGMPTLDRPYSYAADLPWDKFLIQLEKELKYSSHQTWMRDTLKLYYPDKKCGTPQLQPNNKCNDGTK